MKLVQEFRSFRSPWPLRVSLLYLVIAIYLSAIALFGDNDGGVWFFLDFIYWPFSKVMLLLRTALREIIPSAVLHAELFSSVTILNVFDILCSIIAGSVWYFVVTKIVVFLFSKGMKRKQPV
jgi:hypothetical protein